MEDMWKSQPLLCVALLEVTTLQKCGTVGGGWEVFLVGAVPAPLEDGHTQRSLLSAWSLSVWYMWGWTVGNWVVAMVVAMVRRWRSLED
eukprot:CAMPEP_0181053992 /NCGR_PEP_ID=MMETSP1070-20121207/18433_1 /TAXON_ID=265543 /ORGANISM="Minutocellus polymorphus, Strain NH13" /LENGTH=88 /DNA_ID=CAMNT_0023133217 /DNA_START=2122 /DNA_END=2385 /DNA_ORIENTATION=-